MLDGHFFAGTMQLPLRQLCASQEEQVFGGAQRKAERVEPKERFSVTFISAPKKRN